MQHSPPQGLSGLRKTAPLKVRFQESASTINGTQHKSPSSTISQPIPALKQHVPYSPNLKTKSALKVKLTKVTSPCTMAVVHKIVTLKQAFLASFNTIGNMSGTYTIRTNPSITPVPHVHRKVPIEYRGQIECTLSEIVKKGVIMPVSQPTEWVSSLTYPHKPDGILHICLDPKDLNKAIVQEHYKASTLNDISHCSSGATCFSKLDVKDGFWSIHLDEKSSYLTTFNTYGGRHRFLHMPFGLKMSQVAFQM